MKKDSSQITISYDVPLDGIKRVKPLVVPLSYRFVGLLINQLAKVNSDWASSKLTDMWFSVFKRRPKPWVHTFWRNADSHIEVHLSDKCIPVYLWGQGPLVVLVHGWNGSGTQYRYFIPQLVEAGFKVAIFDAPSHGNHPGKYSNLLDFSDTVVGIQKKLGPINSIIAHSFGGMASVLATHRGLKVQHMVLLAPHLDVKAMLDTFAEQLNLSSNLIQDFKSKAIQRIQKLMKIENSMELLHARTLLQGVGVSGILMFDSDDEAVPAEHFQEIESLWNPDHTLKTSGLGHFRLFKDKILITQVVDYLLSEQPVAC